MINFSWKDETEDEILIQVQDFVIHVVEELLL